MIKLGDFSGMRDIAVLERIMEEFQIGIEEVAVGMEVLIAHMQQYDYDGEAWILFRRNGELFEVHGSHCSCYGYEEQWKPEAASVKHLKDLVSMAPSRRYTILPNDGEGNVLLEVGELIYSL